jgi:hypothetical protein
MVPLLRYPKSYGNSFAFHVILYLIKKSITLRIGKKVGCHIFPLELDTDQQSYLRFFQKTAFLIECFIDILYNLNFYS